MRLDSFGRTNEIAGVTGPRPTNRRLLDVAIDHFGRRGLEGASTRAIARDAETPMSSITYHFGGKQGLYLAAADHIAAGIGDMIRPVETAREAEAVSDADAARAVLHGIVARAADMLNSERTAPFARFIVREQADPTEAFRGIYEKTMGPMIDTVSRLIRIVSGNRLDAQQARLRTMTIVGQILVFRVARAAALAATGWPAIGVQETGAIKQVLAENLDAILDRIAVGNEP